MDKALVIRGRFARKAFVPDGPMPDLEGPAELIVYSGEAAQEQGAGESVFGLFGKANRLRSAEDIDLQIRRERQAWKRA